MKTNLTKAAVAIPLALTMIIPSASPILANDGMGSQDQQVEQSDVQQGFAYQINFVGNVLGASNVPESMNGTTDPVSGVVTLPEQAPTADGYTFQGWATSEDGEVAYQAGQTLPIDEDTTMTLYGVWAKASTDTSSDTTKTKKASKEKDTEKVNYSITYASKDIAPSGLPDTQAGTIEKGKAIQLSSATPTADGYTFQGWATKADGDVVYAPGASITMNDDTNLDLYAVWAPVTSIYKFEINYIENTLAASGMPTKQSGQTNETDNMVSLSDAVPTAAGYTFQGWTTKEGGSTVEYKPGQVIDIEKDTTLNLYAVWTKDAPKNVEKEINYNIFFKSNIKVEKGMPSTMSGVLKVSEGNTVKLSTDTPVASGYTFAGWTTDAKGTKAEYKPGDVVTFKTDTSDVQNIQLYALWQKADTKAATTTTNPTSTSTVQTGTETNIGLYAGVTGAAAALLVALGLKKKFNK